jgi:2-polyprenyl-3-methyl-5-hydroxy-6-metoxy-1,4-benzoquinol methylase
MARLSFAWRMAKERWNDERARCPYCESRFSIRLERKWLLIEARQCTHCGLIYRWPTDPADGALDFYECGYEGQQATDIPGRAVLDQLVARNFASSPYDKRDRIAFLERTVGPAVGRSLLDFGCSWGYSAHQYQAAGWRTAGFEFDRNRAEFGRKQLKLDIRSDLSEFKNDAFDLILADHSLEHVPRPGVTIDTLSKIAGKEGIAAIFVPNGSCVAARRLGVSWGPLIGEAHTVAFTMDWFSRNLPRHRWHAGFYNSAGEKLPKGEYLTDHGEICILARRHL